ncbi:MAG: hypothetical protein FWD97_10410 [Defluviitaleaceae bacterium]|nr:hypothetical protein [Defluviitaleaceae bacterium]
MSVMALKNRLGNRVQGVQGASGKGVQGTQGMQYKQNMQGMSGMQGQGHGANRNMQTAHNAQPLPVDTHTPNQNLPNPDLNQNLSGPTVGNVDSGSASAAIDVPPTNIVAPPDIDFVNPADDVAVVDGTIANGSNVTVTDEAIIKDGGISGAIESETRAAAIESISKVSAIQSTPEVATIDSNYLALTTNTIDIINENLKNQPLSFQLFDVVKAPTGGATVFTVPGLTGDEIAKELTGIILDYTTPRAYWETPEPVEGTPPTCYSPDSIVSVDGKPCSTCLYNTFGSKGMSGNGSIGGGSGNGSIGGSNANNNGVVNVNGVGINGAGNSNGASNAKACKESIQALLLLPDSIIPIVIRIPVTSKVIFQKYMTRLVSHMIPLNGVVTKITLEKATSNGGQPYAKFNFEAVEVLTPEEATYARGYGQKFSEMLGTSYDVHDVHGAGYEYQDSHDNGIYGAIDVHEDSGNHGDTNTSHHPHDSNFDANNANIHNASIHNANNNGNSDNVHSGGVHEVGNGVM